MNTRGPAHTYDSSMIPPMVFLNMEFTPWLSRADVYSTNRLGNSVPCTISIHGDHENLENTMGVLQGQTRSPMIPPMVFMNTGITP